MRRLAMKPALAVLMILALIFALEVGLASAQEKIRFSYRQTNAKKVQAVEIGDVKGHWAGMTEFEGVREVTAGPKTMDGALITGVTFWDWGPGNASGHSYWKAVKGTNSDVSKFEMQIRPLTLPAGSHGSEWEGTFTFIKGTGELDGIRGGGTFRGKDVSKNIGITELESEYWIEK